MKHNILVKFNKEIIVSSIHGGLECGVFASIKPGIDIISIGTTVLDAHSIFESCDITTIISTWQLIEEILKNY